MKNRFLLLAAAAVLAWAQDKQPQPLKQPSNIELTVYIVSGLAQPPAGAKDEIPPDLSSVVQQFHGVFTYKSYKLIDQFELRSRNGGGAEIGGELSYFNGGQYDFKYARAAVSPLPAENSVVHINGLRLDITRRPPGPLSTQERAPVTVVLVSTDLDVPDGQKTVVGKSAVSGDAWFLVVVPKIIY